MRKKLATVSALVSILFQPMVFAEDAPESPPADPDPEFFFDDDETFPQGKMVGAASDEGIRVARRARMRNWGLAAGIVAIGVATLVLVSKNHKK